MTAALTDARRLRTCLGHFATGITVVTCDAGGIPHGATVNAFTAVSLDPPLILVSLDRRSKACRLLAGNPFVVNVLRADQRDLAELFAGRATRAVPQWCGTGSTPRLAGALATISCSPWAAHDGGDHVLYLGRVEEFTHTAGEPLVFYQGGFQRLGSP